MSGNAQEKQPAVRPGLLVVLLVVLGGTLYWRFFMQPKPAPPVPLTPSPTTVAPPLTNNNNNNNVENQWETGETPDMKIRLGPISKRDLFLPPSVVIAARRNKNDNVNRSEPVWNEPNLNIPDQEVSSAIKADENPEKPILKGILGTASTQVIIVRYQNKSYLLKLGEILPGTEYRLAEINSSAVVLFSPKGRLNLDRKERSK